MYIFQIYNPTYTRKRTCICILLLEIIIQMDKLEKN